MSVGDIWWQTAAEWLEIAQESQWRAYRKLPSLFLVVQSLTTYDLSFPENGARKWHPVWSTSRRVLTPGEYDKSYRQEPSDVAFRQITLALVYDTWSPPWLC